MRQIPTLVAMAVSPFWLYHVYDGAWGVRKLVYARIFILGLLMAYVFAQPLCHALARALREVRDPALRVTPGTAWEHFFRRFRPLVKPWLWLWLAFILSMNGSIFLLYEKWGFSVITSMLWQAVCWVIAGAFVLAPFGFRATLLAVILASSFGLIYVAEVFVIIIVRRLNWVNANKFFFFTGLAALVLTGLLAWYARRRGDWWFRFVDH